MEQTHKGRYKDHNVLTKGMQSDKIMQDNFVEAHIPVQLWAMPQ